MTAPIGGDADIVLRADGRRLRSEINREIAAAERGSEIDIPVNVQWRDARGRLRDERGRFVAEARDIGEDAGDSMGSGFGAALARALGGFASGLPEVGRVTALSGGIISLGAAAASTAGSIVQLAAALAPAAGAFAAIPGGIALFQAALGTLRLGLTGVGEAIEAAMGDDAAKFEESIRNLAPAAQETARAVRELAPEFMELRNSVQGELFAGLADSLRDLSGSLLGPLREGMSAVAAEMNQIARGIADVASSSSGVTLVNTTFSALAGLLAQIRPGLVLLSRALIELGTVGVNAISGLGGGLAGIITQFAEFVQAAVDSGRATEWIQGAIVVFSQLGDILGGLFGIFRSIGQAASQTGGDVLGTFGQLIGILNEFFQTAQGQSFLLSLFGALNDIGSALQPVLVALGTALAGILPSLGEIAVALGPGLEALITGLGEGLGAIAPALVPIASAVASLAVAFGPILGVVGQLISALGGPLASIVAAVAEALGGIFEAVQPSIEAILPLFTQFASILGETLVPIFTTLGEVLAAILPTILALVVTLAEQMLPIWQQMSAQIGELLPVIGELIIELANALLPILMELLPPWLELQAVLAGPILTVLQLLIPIIVLLVQVLAPVIQIVAALAGVLLNALVGAIQVVVGWIEQFVQWLIDLWQQGADTRAQLVDIWNDIADSVADAFGNIKTWIDTAVQWFVDLPGRILSAISGLGSQIWESITSGIGDLGDLIPGFANGTLTGNRTGLAILHPQEAVIPLQRPARALALSDASGLTDMIRSRDARRGAGEGGRPIEMHNHISTFSPAIAQRIVREALAEALGED